MEDDDRAGARYVLRSTATVPPHGREQIRYAAAFIHPAIRHVWLDRGAWAVETDAPVPPDTIDSGLEKLGERFGSARVPAVKPIFTVAAPAGVTDGHYAAHAARAAA